MDVHRASNDAFPTRQILDNLESELAIGGEGRFSVSPSLQCDEARRQNRRGFAHKAGIPVGGAKRGKQSWAVNLVPFDIDLADFDPRSRLVQTDKGRLRVGFQGGPVVSPDARKAGDLELRNERAWR